MALSLNQLIDRLVEIRDANPALGLVPTASEDSEMGADYPNDIETVIVGPDYIVLSSTAPIVDLNGF